MKQVYRHAAESTQQSGSDGMVDGWISKRMQLQLTRVIGAACQRVGRLSM